MKRPTQSAWRKLLASYEDGFNALLREDLDPEERTACYTVHDLLRVRASEAAETGTTTPTTSSGANDALR